MPADIIAIAQREVGVHEHGGNNCGQRVEEYLAAVGLGAGNPWCAAFVAWCMQRASVQGWPATGDTWALEDWARAHDCLTPHPAAGDVFLLLGSDGRPMHTGLVASVTSSTAIATIEGNTGMASDTDGDGVARKSRAIQACRFIRWQIVLQPAARVMCDGREIHCHPQESLGVTRVDLRPLCDALDVTIDRQTDGIITLRRSSHV